MSELEKPDDPANNTNDATSYMAFISYRHADNTEEDKQWATWLHQQLEVYDVPHELIGAKNLRGEIIPDRIYPVFRDEVSLPANADLSQAITDALDRSQFLVVLCSPRAVQSKYVNEEILHFKATGKEDRIMAGLLLGEPNASIDPAKTEDPEHAETLECFPEALQYRLLPNGELDKSQPTEPIAANFRLPDGRKGVTNPAVYKQQLLEQGRPRKEAERLSLAYEEQINTAKLKIIAGILGVGLEELADRDKLHQLKKAKESARKARRFSAIVGGLMIFALAGAGVAVQQYIRAQSHLERAEDLLGTVRKSIDFLNFDARDAFNNYLPTQERARISEEIDKLAELLAEYGNDSTQDIRQRAVALAQKADLILVNNQMDPRQAEGLYLEANRLLKLLVENAPDSALFQSDLSISFERLGDFSLRLGNTQQALQHYQAKLQIDKKLMALDPENSQFQRDLSISFERLGDLALRLGNTQQALEHYQAALEIAQKRVALNPDTPQFQRGLAVYLEKLGNVALQLGSTQQALEHYQAALDARKKLVTLDPNNSQFQRDLSISFENLGDLAQLRLSNTKQALEHYQAALDTRKKLLALDPDNSQFRHDLSISLERLGDLALKTGNTQQALEHYQATLDARQKLLALDPDNIQVQHDLAVSFDRLGNIALRLDNTQQALEHYQAALEARKKWAALDPENTQFQRGLSVSYEKLGDVALRLGNTQEALKHYQAALDASQKLVTLDRENTHFQRDLAVSYVKLANVYTKKNETGLANTHYQKALDKFLWMQEKGILAENDEQYIPQLKETLSKK